MYILHISQLSLCDQFWMHRQMYPDLYVSVYSVCSFPLLHMFAVVCKNRNNQTTLYEQQVTSKIKTISIDLFPLLFLSSTIYFCCKGS